MGEAGAHGGDHHGHGGKGQIRLRPYEEEGEVGWAREEMGQVGSGQVLVFLPLFFYF